MDPSKGIAIFTDGSSDYRNKTGGWAWVALDAFEGLLCDHGYHEDTTNNRMEMQAVVNGLTTMFNCFGESEVLVYSDSEYVVLGASDRTRKRNKNKDLWKLIDYAVDDHTLVEFVHVKGHQGQEYNEMADKLAGNARRTKGKYDTEGSST